MNIEVVPLRLPLPEGTRIRPAERGFVLPDGRCLRLEPYGAVEDTADRSGSDSWPEYTTARDVEVILPETLAWMDEDGLVELAHLIHQKVVELEMTIDVVGDDVAEIVADEHGPDASFEHLIDLTTAGPYGGRPLP